MVKTEEVAARGVGFGLGLGIQHGVKKALGERAVGPIPYRALVNIVGGGAITVGSLVYAPRGVAENLGTSLGFGMAVGEIVGRLLPNPSVRPVVRGQQPYQGKVMEFR